MLRTVIDILFVGIQHILPAHMFSRLMHRFTRIKAKWIKNAFTRWFVHHFKIDMAVAEEENYRAYENFNQFFTRALKKEARPLSTEKNAILSPVDGAVSQAEIIHGNRVFQAKNHDFTLNTLLGGDNTICDLFVNGLSTTLYLSPRDYHRIHMPLSGKLTKVIHIPGRLFSVNRVTTHNVPGLFARNERVVCLFDTDAGQMAMILVGAINVASIETVWQGEITPPAGKRIQSWDYSDKNISLQAGEEMGRFNMGSTVLLLFSRDRVKWTDRLIKDAPVNMGECIGYYQ